ncbi:MAG: transcription termination factor Rho, partial [Planctomycetota bacterium]
KSNHDNGGPDPLANGEQQDDAAIDPDQTVTGIYEQGPKSDGRLRQLDNTLLSYPRDPVVASHLVERYGLRPGLHLECTLGKPFGGGQQPQQHGRGKKKKQKYFAIDPQARRVQDIVKIEGMPASEYGNTRRFEDLTSVMPEPRLSLEYPDCPPACRLIDLFCPVGYGTRGMIVSPPKAGKTTLLQNIAFAIQKNHPEVEVFALLIDERPEEVTDFRRNVPCTVWASSNDHTPEKHCALAIAAIERCKRLAELGKDVVVLMDSLTRLGRAFNTAPGMASTGRTLSGGLDAGALAVPKQLFGAARRFEEGGSLTIVATALVDTGSRGDQVIFEEFKGTGNMELILDRKIAEQRLFPAIDLAASGTRNEDKLITNNEELETVNKLRRRLLNMNPVQQIEQLLGALKRFETNDDLVGNPQSPASDAATARR